MRFGRVVGTVGWPLAHQVSRPAIWGKLPTHADYVQHAVRAGEAQAWQHWLIDQVRPARKPAGAAPRGPWVRLDTPPERPAARELPASFVLPPGSLAAGAQRHLLGVAALSEDRLGRHHPVIVYQGASTRWLQQHLPERPPGDGNPLQDWLFTLARLLGRYTQAGPGAGMALHEAVDRLWSLYAPAAWWRSGRLHRAAPAAVATVMGLAPAPRDPDPAEQAMGVDTAPWADWPHRLWSPRPQPAFWQQDHRGAYVGASTRLGALWGH